MKEPTYIPRDFMRKHFTKEWNDPYHWLLEAPTHKLIAKENEYYKHSTHLDKEILRELNLRFENTKPQLRIKTDEGYYVTLLNKNKLSKMTVTVPNTGDSKKERVIEIDDDIINYQFGKQGRYLFYSKESEDGSEVGRIHIRNIIKDRQIDILRNVTTTFAIDQDRNIYYGRIDKTGRVSRFYKYVWKTKEEVLLYEEIDPTIDLDITISSCKKFLFVSRVQTFASQVFAISLTDGKNSMHPMTDFKPDVEYQIEYSNGIFYYLITTKHKGYSLQVSRSSKNLREIYRPSHKKSKIILFSVVDSHIYIQEQSAGKSYFYMITPHLHTKKHARIIKLSFPDPVFEITMMTDSINWKSKQLFLRYTAPLTPPTYYTLDWKEMTIDIRNTNGCGYLDKTNYELKLDYVGAHKIPVHYFYRKDLIRPDNQNPLYIIGYGAYGSMTDTNYKSDLIALTERGYICAYAFVRGGGDVSEDWYYCGTNGYKKNTFNDFIAVTRYLQDKFSCPKKTVAFGRSAGGFLIGAIANQAPELYNTIYMQSPFVDVLNTLLDPKLPLTTIESYEFGDPRNNESDFNNLYALAPYENIEKKRYPNIVIELGVNDNRVNYRESLRYVAKMRSMRDAGNGTKVLLCIDRNTGHFPNDVIEIELAKKTRTLAFIMKNIEGSSLRRQTRKTRKIN